MHAAAAVAAAAAAVVSLAGHVLVVAAPAASQFHAAAVAVAAAPVTAAHALTPRHVLPHLQPLQCRAGSRALPDVSSAFSSPAAAIPPPPQTQHQASPQLWPQTVASTAVHRAAVMQNRSFSTAHLAVWMLLLVILVRVFRAFVRLTVIGTSCQRQR